MTAKFSFDPAILDSIVSGHSAIDIPHLSIHTFEEATSFLYSYGFDIKNENDISRLWYFHRRALVLIHEKLGFNEDEIPEVFKDRKNLGDIRQLLIFASSRNPAEKEMQAWACAILRCMHVFVHAENDLFSSFGEEIQSQILSPFQKHIVNDGNTHRTYLKGNEGNIDPIELLGFEVKPFKTSTSTVIKLLAKPDALAMKIFDKLGVRFITSNLFDTFQVVRLLARENIISFPHIMPDQSSNNLYPASLFLEVCEELSQVNHDLAEGEIQDAFDKKMIEKGDSVKLLRKENSFSGDDYKFIKFISRKLIQIKPDGDKQPFSFFYPFEVQIMDKAAHDKILSGPSEHQAYKERQIVAARKRLFPLSKG